MWFSEKQIDFLNILWKTWIDIISGYSKIDNIYYLNNAIFKNKEIPKNFYLHKKDFISNIEIIRNNLMIFKVNNNHNSEIEETEFNYMMERLNFLLESYDIESSKIWNKIKLNDNIYNLDYYNNIFFKTNNKEIFKNNNDIFPIYWEKTKEKISKNRLIELLEKVKIIIPNLLYTFWEFSYMSHSKGTLKIPEKSEYTIKNVIILFFHELTHFLRRQNQINNYWFDYSFSDYMDFEEWIALYNEYYYWNLLINWWYWEYFPIYDYLYSILKYTPISSKKDTFMNSLITLKWVSEKTAEDYYNRFYRYTIPGWDKFFLKESCYNKWLQNVKKELEDNRDNYNKIMSWRIGYSIYGNFHIYWETNKNILLDWVFEILKKELIF